MKKNTTRETHSVYKDRNTLKRLVESYGKKDVLNYIEHVDEEYDLEYDLVDDLYEEPRKKVFLGGTCNNSTWRDELIPMLEIDYFNPVVPDWNDAAYRKELHEREVDDFCLYVLTSEMVGFYSIAEVVDDSNKRPEKCVLCVLKDGFDNKQIKSFNAIEKMVAKNGGTVCQSLEEVAEYLNNA